MVYFLYIYVEGMIKFMSKKISDELVIGNALISTKKNQMTKKQIHQYLEIVDALLPENYYTYGNNNSFESFCEEYDFLVKRIRDIVIIDCDMAQLERYCRIGIPTEVAKVFDEAGTKLNEIEIQAINDAKYNRNSSRDVETFKKNNLLDEGTVLKKTRKFDKK